MTSEKCGCGARIELEDMEDGYAMVALTEFRREHRHTLTRMNVLGASMNVVQEDAPGPVEKAVDGPVDEPVESDDEECYTTRYDPDAVGPM